MKNRRSITAALTAALIVIMVAPPSAQMQPAAARSNGAVGAGPVEQVDLLVGRSLVLRTDRPIKRVSVPKPDIADALVTSPNEVLVHGKAPGTISLLIWGDTGQIRTYDISVRRDLVALEQQMRELFPGEPIAISSNGSDVVLSGIVSSKYVVERASSVAAGYVEKKESVVNLLRQQEGIASNQIMLRVRFAEVSRSALQELGASFFTGPAGRDNWMARTTTQQFPSPVFDADKGLVFSDFLNLFAFNTQEQLGAVVKALQTKGLFQSLAEPNLVTQNGKEASFLAGGEFPIPVVQGGGLNAAVTIMFKEFGVRLRFTPTVVGDDLIHLKVAPEVSSLDFGNAVTIEGFRVPALSTRRTETEVELRDGQPFAISGLIDNSVTQTMSKVPGIGDIPILGLLFKSRAYQKNATELVVMITPHILRRDSPGVTPNLPGPVQPFLGPERRIPQPPPAFITPGRPPTGNEPSPRAQSAAPGAVGDPAGTVEAPAAGAAPAPSAVEAPALSGVEGMQRDDDRKRAEEARKQEQARARETAKVEAERQRKESAEADRVQKAAEQQARAQAEIDRKRFAEEKKQAERDRVQQEKLAKERAVREAAEAARAAEIEKARLEEERRQADDRRKVEEKIARERAKLDAEFAKRAGKLEELRLQEERLRAEERKKAEEKRAKERQKRLAEIDKMASTDTSRIGPSPRGYEFR